MSVNSRLWKTVRDVKSFAASCRGDGWSLYVRRHSELLPCLVEFFAVPGFMRGACKIRHSVRKWIPHNGRVFHAEIQPPFLVHLLW